MLILYQVLWELLTKEVPFNGIEGFQVAWLVVEKGEVINYGLSIYVVGKNYHLNILKVGF